MEALTGNHRYFNLKEVINIATFTWYLQGTSPTTIEATDIVQFAGGTFGSAITVDAWNSSTHVESSVGADDSESNGPKNCKFISQTGGTAGDSQCDIGGGTVDIDAVSTANSPLKINFSDDASVTTTGAIFYAYDGSTTTEVPTGVNFKAAEQGDAVFTDAEGSAAAVTIADDTAGTSHDYFLLVSASPTSVGVKTAFKLRIELTYS